MYIDNNCIWTKYGTDPVQDILVDSDSVQDRIKSAKNHYGLDRLISDKEWSVRRAVAKEGFGLDILINDPISLVRVAVVRQGYRLDNLLNDIDIHLEITGEICISRDFVFSDANVYIWNILMELKLKKMMMI